MRMSKSRAERSACLWDMFMRGMYVGRFYKLVSKDGWCFYLAWMSFRLSHRIFLFFIQSRSPLRSFM